MTTNSAFGRTGLTVPRVGLGTVPIGRDELTDAQAERLLHAALDEGLTLIDTARSYGKAEERIGQFLASRRREFVLSSKCGYDIPDHTDWTGPCITAGVDAALRRLRTDHIDILHLHSCDLEVLQRGEVIDALARARAAGKIGAAAYSGDHVGLQYAIECGRFDSIQVSVNLCDQRAIDAALPLAADRGLGVIAKRPLANAFWRFRERPAGDYAEEYWRRAREMQIDPGRLSWDEFALRFAAWQPGVHAVIVGTANLAHLRRAREIVARGPLEPDAVAALRATFRRCDQDWTGQI